MAKNMYQKREERKQNRLNNDEQGGFKKTVINWYPGHMAKTKRLIKEMSNVIDVVYELVDARIPYSSKLRNTDDMLSNKPRILIMTKRDLCDEVETNKWIKEYQNKGYHVIWLDLTKTGDYNELVKMTNEIMQAKQDKRNNKGLKNQEIRVLVLGIPNVGKSTLINRLAHKKVVNVGNTPGVTKQLSWLKTDSNILLLDSPGILWPNLETEEIALNLASMSAIKAEILPDDRVACYIIKKLSLYYPNMLEERYGLKDFNDDYEEAYEIIGRKIGAVISGGNIDYKRVSLTVINDLKNEYIKGITFDRYDKKRNIK